MKEFLEKIKLVDYMTTEIEMQKDEFVKKFKESVDEGSVDFFSGAFDVFSSSKNEYKGHVGLKDFEIKRRKRMFDVNMSFAVAKGKFKSNEENIIVETEINGFSGMMIPFYLFLILFYLGFVGMIFFAGETGNDEVLMAFPFLIIHAVFMLGIPYFMMRRGVKRMKYELERDFFYLTKE